MEKEFLHQELEVAQAGADIKENTGWRRAGRIFATSIFAFSILLTISAVVFTVVFFISEVEGASMMLTLNPTYKENPKAKDHVLVNRYSTPKPGDVIVVRHYWQPWQEQYKKNKMEYFVKRLIAVEGQRVRFNKYGEFPIDTYKTVVDDIEIAEPYLDGFWGKMTGYGRRIYDYLEKNNDKGFASTALVPFHDRCVFQNSETGKWEIVVPKGEIFFMGDQRGFDDPIIRPSYDCTSFGPQPAEYVEGVSVDTIRSDVTMPQYVWSKIQEFFSFKWLFG